MGAFLLIVVALLHDNVELTRVALLWRDQNIVQLHPECENAAHATVCSFQR